MTEEEACDDTGTPPAYTGELSKNTVTIAGAEMNNLASQYPARVKKMADEWRAWADRMHVYPKAMEKPKKRDQKGKGGDSAKAED
jgi:hypothetical protein